MLIETSRLIIRSLKASDAQPLAALWSNPQVTIHMGGPRNYQELVEIFTTDAAQNPQPVFDLWPVEEKSSGQVIGHCGLIDKEVDGQPEVELVYVLHPDYWGKGFATEMALAVRDEGFAHLGLKRIISLIDGENAPSQRVAERVGMHFEKETTRPGGKVLKVFALQAAGEG